MEEQNIPQSSLMLGQPRSPRSGPLFVGYADIFPR